MSPALSAAIASRDLELTSSEAAQLLRAFTQPSLRERFCVELYPLVSDDPEDFEREVLNDSAIVLIDARDAIKTQLGYTSNT